MPGPRDTDVGQKDDLEFIRELERQSIDEISKLRAHERYETQIPIRLHAGNSSDVDRIRPLDGYTRDVSSGGCLTIFNRPIPVGDIFRVEFAEERVDLPSVFARCLRCRLVREDAFEASFSFFQDISLSELRARDKRDQSLI